MEATEPEGAPELLGFEQFEFALTDALITQLVKVLNQIAPAPLEIDYVSKIPNGQGVYQLWVDDQLEYIGKTDTDAGLTTRLAKHAAKISGRPALRGRVEFKAVQVLVFTAMELETLLIRHYKGAGAPMSWQHSGFGSNDPGRERDTTKYKKSHFDLRFPIDMSEPFGAKLSIPPGTSIKKVLKEMKSSLPYNIRFQRSKDLNTKIPQALELSSAADGLAKLMNYLPTGWQATNLPGYAILYKEKIDYKFGTVISRS